MMSIWIYCLWCPFSNNILIVKKWTSNKQIDIWARIYLGPGPMGTQHLGTQDPGPQGLDMRHGVRDPGTRDPRDPGTGRPRDLGHRASILWILSIFIDFRVPKSHRDNSQNLIVCDFVAPAWPFL